MLTERKQNSDGMSFLLNWNHDMGRHDSKLTAAGLDVVMFSHDLFVALRAVCFRNQEVKCHFHISAYWALHRKIVYCIVLLF